MGLHHSPFSVTDGLVLYLDAGNKKTFANSVINSTSWDLGSGSASGYGQNGATAENERVTGTDPFGKSATVWETRPTGTTNEDGGWNTGWYNIDNTKLYRFSVWVKRTTTSSGGTFYLGLYGNASGIKRTDNDTVEGNPYWDCRGTGGFDKDVWYLVVGHCYPYNTSYTGQHPETGIYTVAGGATKVLSINACNIGADVKWAGSDVTQTIHRCYHYYCSDSTTRLQLFDPRIDAIDGTEPSISALLSGFTANRLTDLVGTNNGTFKNAPTYSSVNGGSISFDGTDDYVALPQSFAFGTSTFSIECWVNADTLSGIDAIYYSQSSNAPGFYGVGHYAGSGGFFLSDFNGSTRITTYFGSDAVVNTWYHLVFLKNSSNQYVVYRNAVASTTNNTSTTSLSSSDPRIGYNPASGSEIWDGKIANFKIYNRALTAQEIQQNFNALRGRFGI